MVSEYGVLDVGAGDAEQLSLSKGMIGPYNNCRKANAHWSDPLASPGRQKMPATNMATAEPTSRQDGA
jgi:hypothetical protein